MRGQVILTRCLLLAIVSGIGSLCLRVPTASGQDTKSKEQSALTEGLLDLLAEPANAPGSTPAPAPAARSTELVPAGQTPKVGPPNPLSQVQRSMLAAAGNLSQGLVGTETQRLQSDIVKQLDTLIAELNKASEPPANSQSPPEQQRQSQKQPGGDSSQAESDNAQAKPPSPALGDPAEGEPAEGEPAEGETSQPGSRASSQDSPASEGAAAQPLVDLADPRTLQENVWGQLPEQVRKQMQSRMVERFLPSYRAQIEAYFQALLEDSP